MNTWYRAILARSGNEAISGWVTGGWVTAHGDSACYRSYSFNANYSAEVTLIAAINTVSVCGTSLTQALHSYCKI
ncbi:MAG: hypothetical protein ABIN99_00645, partial [Nitrosospira sp.]